MFADKPAGKTVISLSGGMDSTGLLMHLLAQNCEVFGISFNYGQKHILELERLKANIAYLRTELVLGARLDLIRFLDFSAFFSFTCHFIDFEIVYSIN